MIARGHTPQGKQGQMPLGDAPVTWLSGTCRRSLQISAAVGYSFSQSGPLPPASLLDNISGTESSRISGFASLARVRGALQCDWITPRRGLAGTW